MCVDELVAVRGGTRRRSVVVLGAALVGIVACGTDPASVTIETVVGSYEATVLVLEDIDILAAGGSLDVSLRPDSTVEGALFVPGALGGPASIDMAGSFRVRDGFVTFSQAAPTFMREVPFRWSGGVLSVMWSGEGDGGEARLERR
jgi:hypothetical protein